MAEWAPSFRCTAEPAGEAAQRLAGAITAQAGRVRLAVAGGSVSPVLGQTRHLLGPGLWSRVRLTWVDERCVPFAHPYSNRGGAYRGGDLDPADPPGLELPLFLEGETQDAACLRVRTAFQRDFEGRLDLLLLGLGEDGHIASLFPGREYPEGTVLAVGDSPKPPPCRITFSLPILAQAPVALMLVLGSSKRAPLQRLRNGDPALPGSALHHLEIFTDLEMAASGETA